MMGDFEFDFNDLDAASVATLDLASYPELLDEPHVGAQSIETLPFENPVDDAFCANLPDATWPMASPGGSNNSELLAGQTQPSLTFSFAETTSDPFEAAYLYDYTVRNRNLQPQMNQPVSIAGNNLGSLQETLMRSRSVCHTPERTLPRNRSRYFVRSGGGRLHSQRLPSIPTFAPQLDVAERSYHPLQRWRQSSPDDEPASILSIRNALEAVADDGQGPASGETSVTGSVSEASFRALSRRKVHRAKSTISCSSDNSISSQPSSVSSWSALSYDSARMSGLNPSQRARQKPKRRLASSEAEGIFKCTFCCDNFKRKYDWARHEKSLHLNISGWKCAPLGGAVLSPLAKRMVCAYCNALDPTSEHMDSHNHQACQTEAARSKVFLRKDHLTQHLRVTHHLEVMPLIEGWKLETPTIRSRCGFCDARLATWDERTDHLAAHFHQKMTMDSWRGDHGFDPEIAALVQNAWPPYLLAEQSRTVIPYSVTNAHSVDHFEQMRARVTSSEFVAAAVAGKAPGEPWKEYFEEHPASRLSTIDLLSYHLSSYIRQQLEKGIIPTDEMLQHESRKVAYACDDSWNQTAADNPEWLTTLKQSAGLLCNMQQNPHRSKNGPNSHNDDALAGIGFDG